MSEELSRLEEVELREIWPNEAQDFTPWLAEEENLTLLGETLGMELEFESKELNVGDFRADILCRNRNIEKPEHKTRVLIENQLKETNHSHLGQILTYAAGLGTYTVIWIAKKFREEHRAALDHLNEITDERFRYFGVEIKVWKIGDSTPAPQFEIVSKPDDWKRTVSQNTERAVSGDISETQLQLERFWTALQDYMVEKSHPIKLPKPSPWRYLILSIGRTGFNINPRLATTKKEIGVDLYISSEQNTTAHFHLLKEQQAEIEKEFGEPLEWEELPNRKSSRISLRQEDTDPADETDWSNQHEWLASKLELFDKVFRSRVKALDAANWEPPEDEDGE